MSIKKDIAELLEAQVISEKVANEIRAYYASRQNKPNNRLFIVFGILGAILVGLGIILIIAHNWDDLSKPLKTSFAFLPLLIGQVLCGFVLLKRNENIAWREASAAFLVFAIATSISLISQIYNIPGDLSSFILTWMLLTAPLVYLLRSSIASVLFLCGITYYVTETAYWSYPNEDPWPYWGMLVFILPYYYQLFKKNPHSNFTLFHHWLIPLSITITLGSITEKHGEILLVAYMALFSLFYSIGHSKFFKDFTTRSNGYKVIGSLGIAGLLLTMSFNELWKELFRNNFADRLFLSPEFIVTGIIILFALTIIYYNYKNDNTVKPISLSFVIFTIVFILGSYDVLAAFIMNFLALSMGLFTIVEGAKKDNLGILNYGLLIITGLVICRFFDTNISFILRGLLFVGVGIAFFLTNMWMLKKRRASEQ